jgi:hypothetical protein
VTPRSPSVRPAGGAQDATRPPVRHARWSRLAWLRALPRLVQPVTRTMPWDTLLTGCLAGTGFLAVLAHVAEAAHWSLGQGNVRVAFVPAVAALAFVLRTPFRPLIQATPVPAWVASAGHLLLAAPLLVATCLAQLRIMTHTIPSPTVGHLPPIYPLIAQLAGWCAVTVAAAACVDRSRFADLGGAIAAPVSFAAIALIWYAPVSARLFVAPPATPHGVTIAWYATASAGLALTWIAMRDHWHRYARRLHRLSAADSNLS